MRYRQVYVEDTYDLEWYVDGGHFQYVEAEAMGITHYEDGFKIAVEGERHFPDGALFSVDSGNSGFVKDPRGYTIARCEKDGGKVVLEKPTLPLQHWVESPDHLNSRSVWNIASRVSQKLMG